MLWFELQEGALRQTHSGLGAWCVAGASVPATGSEIRLFGVEWRTRRERVRCVERAAFGVSASIEVRAASRHGAREHLASPSGGARCRPLRCAGGDMFALGASAPSFTNLLRAIGEVSEQGTAPNRGLRLSFGVVQSFGIGECKPRQEVLATRRHWDFVLAHGGLRIAGGSGCRRLMPSTLRSRWSSWRCSWAGTQRPVVAHSSDPMGGGPAQCVSKSALRSRWGSTSVERFMQLDHQRLRSQPSSRSWVADGVALVDTYQKPTLRSWWSWASALRDTRSPTPETLVSTPRAAQPG